MLDGAHDHPPPQNSLSPAEFVAPVIQLPSRGFVLRDVLLTPWKTLRRKTRAAKSAQAAVKDESEINPLDTQQPERTAVQRANEHSNYSFGGIKPEPVDDDTILLDRTVIEPVKKEILSDEPLAAEKYTIYEEFQHLKDEDIKQAITALSNPIAKIKKDLELNYEFVWDRLRDVGLEWFPIDLDEATRYHTFSRYYIANLYGGSTVDTFPRIDPEKVAIHGIDNFCFPSLEWNPHAPKHPGAPGLFFVESHATGTWDSRVIVRLKSGVWLNCGTYRFTPSQSLTSFEFQNQADRVQHRWAKEIKARKWGTDLVVRVHLRDTLGREPSEEEVLDASADGNQAQRIVNSVTEEQVMDAFKNGQEEIGVYCMKCVEYDTEWQKFLVRHYAGWARKYEARRARKTRKPPKNHQSGKKRRTEKPADIPAKTKQMSKLAGLGSDLSDLSELENENSEDGVVFVHDDKSGDESQGEAVALLTMAKGTRSRPRVRDQEPIFVE